MYWHSYHLVVALLRLLRSQPFNFPSDVERQIDPKPSFAELNETPEKYVGKVIVPVGEVLSTSRFSDPT
ncbi:MAG: hypothetical protein AB7T38_04935 [Nitrospirales bacterium]